MSLKRSGPLKRTKGLDWATPKAREFANRRSSIDRTPMVTKTSERKKADHAAMAKARPGVRRRSRGMCELRIPGVCEGRSTNAHHRLEESQGGPSTEENLIDVCGFGNTSGCHGWVHTQQHHLNEEGDDDGSYARGWLLHAGDDPAAIAWDQHEDGWRD